MRGYKHFGESDGFGIYRWFLTNKERVNTMSQMTAVGVIAKGSRDACITLARILLPDGCQIEKKGKR